MTIKETVLPLIDKLIDVAATHQVHAKERAALCAALDAADREVERLKDAIDHIKQVEFPDKLRHVTTAILAQRDALKAENAALRSEDTVERLVEVVYKHWQDPRNHRPVEIRKDIRAALGEKT